jgi:hypothetical protein
METSKMPAFRKVRVIGPRQAVALEQLDAQHKKATALRDYNPTLNAMVDAQAEMQNVLHDDVKQHTVMAPKNKKPRKRPVAKRPAVKQPGLDATTKVALHNAALDRLKALKSQFDSSYEPLLQLLMQNMNGIAGAAAAAQANTVVDVAANDGEDVDEFATPTQRSREHSPERGDEGALPLDPAHQPRTLFDTPASTQPSTSAATTVARTPRLTTDTTKLLSAVPKSYHAECKDLYEYLQRNTNVIRMADNGRMICRGAVVHGSSYIDAIRALY